MKVAVFGSTGKTGKYLVPALADAGHDVLALGRNPDRLAMLDRRCERIVADLESPAGLKASLGGCDCVVSLAHARFAGTVLSTLPDDCKRVVLTGSVRRFTALADPAADAVRDGEAAFRASGRPGVVLHPSMIFGSPEERNINRILDRIERWPAWLPVVVPLPGGGGRLVQPVYYEDVVAAYTAAVARPQAVGEAIVLAGPAPLTYADMVRLCAAGCGRRARILPISASVLATGARAIAAAGGKPPLSPAEIRRADEDKAFDISPMTARLGVTPRAFAAALDQVVARRRHALAGSPPRRHDTG